MCKEEILFHYLDSGIQTDGTGDRKKDQDTKSGETETETEESETQKLKRLLAEQKAENESLRIEKHKLEQRGTKPDSEDKQREQNAHNKNALEREQARAKEEEEEKRKAYAIKIEQTKRKIENGNEEDDEEGETERKKPKHEEFEMQRESEENDREAGKKWLEDQAKEAEKKRLEDQAKEAEKKRLEDQAKEAEKKRLEDQAKEAEKKRLEDQAKEAEKKRLEDQAKEAEKKRLEDQAKEAEKKRLEDQAKEVEKKRLEDQAKEVEKKSVPVKEEVKNEAEGTKQVNSTFIFDSDGIPIWDVRPLPSVPQQLPGWDADKWVAHMTDEYNSSREKLFDCLYKSAVRKKKRRDQDEKDRIEKLVQEARDKAECERKEKEERDKEAARIRREKREKLEKEGQEYVEQLISLNFEFTDEESDDEEAATKSNGNTEEAENTKGKPDNAVNGEGDPEYAQNGNSVPDKTEPTDEDETDLDDKQPLGGEASDANSCILTYSTPSRTPQSSERLSNKSATKHPRPMSANMVQILSDPKIIVALEQFQGIRKEQNQVQLLSNPKIIVALKEFHAAMERGNFHSEEKVEVELFNEAVLHNMKQEDKMPSRLAKRKLTEYDEFTKVLTTPKRRKKETEKEFAFSAGSPHRGKVATHDATLEELKKMVDVKIDWVRKGDKLLAGSKSTQSKTIFTQVTYCFFFVFKFLLIYYGSNCHFLLPLLL